MTRSNKQGDAVLFSGAGIVFDPLSSAFAGTKSETIIELERAIEAEIIPRLLLSHVTTRVGKTSAETRRDAHPPVFTQTEVAEFAALVMKQPIKDAMVYVDALLAQGLSAETLILEVLSPAAQHLGELWVKDRITFIDVTLGVSRLQQLLRTYGFTTDRRIPQSQNGRRMLLAVVPGEQHTFGTAVVEEFFCRDGWDVATEVSGTRQSILASVRHEWFDVVGLSASGDSALPHIAPLIDAVREMSLNRHIRVIVGGCSFLAQPQNALALGADMAACNGKDAVLNVERLLATGALH